MGFRWLLYLHLHSHLSFVCSVGFQEFYVDCWAISTKEKFWPFDEADIGRIIEYLFSSYIHKIIIRLQAIEIKMIDIGTIFMVVGVCRTLHGYFLTQMDRDEIFGECRFSGSEVSSQKYPIPDLWYYRNRSKVLSRKGVCEFLLHNLHYMKYCANINPLII